MDDYADINVLELASEYRQSPDPVATILSLAVRKQVSTVDICRLLRDCGEEVALETLVGLGLSEGELRVKTARAVEPEPEPVGVLLTPAEVRWFKDHAVDAVVASDAQDSVRSLELTHEIIGALLVILHTRGGERNG